MSAEATGDMTTGHTSSAAVDAGEIALRHAKIRESMAQSDLDLLIVYSSPLRPFNVHYASNYDLIGDGAFVAISRDRDPILYVSEEWDLERAAAASPIKDVRYSANLAQVAGRMLHQTRSAVAGLDFADGEFAKAVKNEAGREVDNGASVLDRAARRKTPVELSLIREAAALADLGFQHGFDVLVEGMREFELAAEIEFAMRSAGAVDNFGLLSSGKHNRVIGIPTDKTVDAGDLLIFEITPARLSRNDSAQLCRTICMGPANQNISDKHRILQEAMEAGIARVKPGVPLGEVVVAQDEVISRYGFGDYCRPPYMRARGHGFGVGRVDLTSTNKQLAEPGMAMIVHPNQYFPDLGYLALGEMVIVTDSGTERLSRLQPDLYQRT